MDAGTVQQVNTKCTLMLLAGVFIACVWPGLMLFTSLWLQAIQGRFGWGSSLSGTHLPKCG